MADGESKPERISIGHCGQEVCSCKRDAAQGVDDDEGGGDDEDDDDACIDAAQGEVGVEKSRRLLVGTRVRT